MYLNLQGLGRLESASIDLSKSLLIFVGRNNTSKTYLAHTIYALHRFGAGYLAASVHELIRELKLPPLRDVWHHELSVVDFLMPHLPRFIRELGELVQTRLPKIFATDKQFFSKTRVEMQLAPDEEPDIRKRLLAQELSYSLGFEDWQISVRKPRDSDVISVDCIWTRASESGPPKVDFTLMPSTFGVPAADLLLRALLPGCSDPFILSTERSAIQLFSRELYGNRSRVIDDIYEYEGDWRSSSITQIAKETRFYPLAIRDELRFINELLRNKNESSTLAPLADRLESLLGGAVVLDESGDLMYKPEGLDRAIGLHVSASSVKSLAGLAFYLRHMAPRDGLLVIDEPELNLHPDNQRSIARILAEIARAGVRVLISTHSDYVIRELSNLIALHPPEAAALREKHGYSESETLDAASVGAYLFEQTSARPLDVAGAGIEVETIDNEINAMNRVAKDIYFNLQSKPTPT